jgi:predicted glycosyltransferase
VRFADFVAHKGRLLLGLVQHLRPRVIVIDHFPFHTDLERAVECEAALAHLRDAVPETLHCAGYRGVSTMTGDDAAFDARRRLIVQYVDLLLVYVDPRERDAFFDAHRFLRPVEEKVRFVGYVAGPPRDGVQRAAGPTRVLATFGSGTDAYRAIRLVCDAFRLFAAARPAVILDVVTGDRLPGRAFRQITAAYGDAPRIRITRSVSALGARLAEYDLVVSRGGYNACVELYQAGARSIVLPRVPRGRPAEQVEEARKFHGYGGIDSIVDAAATSPEALARLMTTVLAAPPAPRAPVDLGGAGRAAALLHAELDRRGRPRVAERWP